MTARFFFSVGQLGTSRRQTFKQHVLRPTRKLAVIDRAYNLSHAAELSVYVGYPGQEAMALMNAVNRVDFG